MIHPYIFTYKGDQEETIACVSSLKKVFPESLITVVEDAKAPLDNAYVEGLIEMGIRVETSFFERHGNLRGMDCINGMLSYFCEGRLKNDDVILKVDADTLVLGAEWLKNSLEYDFVASGYTNPKNAGERLAYGCCYALKGQIARLAKETLKTFPHSETCPEDVTIFQAVKQHTNAIKLFEPWNEKNQDSKWTAWNWFSETVHPRKYAYFEVITFGNPRPQGFPKNARGIAMNKMLDYKSMFANALVTSESVGR